jgi:DNA polymerase-3 subunit delta'
MSRDAREISTQANTASGGLKLPTSIEVPWLAPQLEQLQRARRSGRFPSALLIHDQRGAGGEWLARYAAQLGLCRAPTAPCGQCRDCRQFLCGQHPDFVMLTPLEDSKYIRIEQVRELAEQLVLSSHAGGATLALISPADALNPNAANALLKTLEEPRPGVTLLLVASTPSRLPATILSRCQRLRIRPPARAESVAWLERNQGPGPWGAVLDVLGEAPFEALERDAVQLERLAAETFQSLCAVAAGRLEVTGLAQRWARAESFELRLACLETWLTACIDEVAGAPRQSPEMRSSAHLPASVSDMNMTGLLGLLEGAYELRRLRLTSINRSLALEQLLGQLARGVRLRAVS